jgi:glyoxylase-like metal-dependent hydrolase (beta-lactamase superfamily II)
VITVDLTVLDTGFCTARASLVAAGTGWREIRCHATAFVLQHPQRGTCLFDTGYAPRLLNAFAHWPDRLYKYATPTTLGRSVVQQLQDRGIAATAVHTVILSHLHADHVAGLRDFPQASIALSRAAFMQQQSVSGFGAVRRGVLQSLFPNDFAARSSPIDGFTHGSIPHLGPTYDLFGDGTVQLMLLRGHARGQLGAFVRTADGDVLLCADGAWTSQAYREQRGPHWLATAIQDNMSEHAATLRALHAFNRARPDVPILPTHCPETLAWVHRP